RTACPPRSPCRPRGPGAPPSSRGCSRGGPPRSGRWRGRTATRLGGGAPLEDRAGLLDVVVGDGDLGAVAGGPHDDVVVGRCRQLAPDAPGPALGGAPDLDAH